MQTVMQSLQVGGGEDEGRRSGLDVSAGEAVGEGLGEGAPEGTGATAGESVGDGPGDGAGEDTGEGLGEGVGVGDATAAAGLAMVQVAPLTLKESGMKLLASLAERVSPMLTSEAALAGRFSHDASAVPLRRPPEKLSIYGGRAAI